MDRFILLIGIAVILGSIGGRIFAWLRIPQVVGYIIIGVLAILVGGVWLHSISPEDIQRLEPISLFALAIIGFSVGGELKKEVFQKHGKGFIIVLLCEGLTAALFVTILTGLVTCPWSKFADGSIIRVLSHGNWSLAILLGAIASATAPAATVDVMFFGNTKLGEFSPPRCWPSLLLTMGWRCSYMVSLPLWRIFCPETPAFR